MCVLSIKVPIRKKSGNLLYAFRISTIDQGFCLVYLIAYQPSWVIQCQKGFIPCLRKYKSENERKSVTSFRTHLLRIHCPALFAISSRIPPIESPTLNYDFLVCLILALVFIYHYIRAREFSW